MTKRHAQTLVQLHNLVASAEHAESQYKNRGDRQISIAHLRSIVRQANALIDDLSKGTSSND